MVKREWTQIEDQPHKMWAEGTSDEEPTIEEIIELLKKENWEAKNIQVWMDNLMGFWRWTSDINKNPHLEKQGLKCYKDPQY